MTTILNSVNTNLFKYTKVSSDVTSIAQELLEDINNPGIRKILIFDTYLEAKEDTNRRIHGGLVDIKLREAMKNFVEYTMSLSEIESNVIYKTKSKAFVKIMNSILSNYKMSSIAIRDEIGIDAAIDLSYAYIVKDTSTPKLALWYPDTAEYFINRSRFWLKGFGVYGHADDMMILYLQP